MVKHLLYMNDSNIYCCLVLNTLTQIILLFLKRCSKYTITTLYYAVPSSCKNIEKKININNESFTKIPANCPPHTLKESIFIHERQAWTYFFFISMGYFLLVFTNFLTVLDSFGW